MEWWHTVLGFFEDAESLIVGLSTFVIAVFTGSLWWATYKLQKMAVQQSKDMKEALDNAKKQIDLTRDEFNATHRPILRVRKFVVDAGPIGVVQFFPLRVNVEICNVGASPAVTPEIQYSTAWIGKVRDLTERFEKTDPPEQIADQIGPGAFFTYALKHAGDPVPEDPNALIRTYDRRLHFALVGRLSYRDARGNVRTTGFIRQANSDGESMAIDRFEKVEGSDFEYED